MDEVDSAQIIVSDTYAILFTSKFVQIHQYHVLTFTTFFKYKIKRCCVVN